MSSLYQWRPVFWEPVHDTGERLMVGVILRDKGWLARRLIRDDVLDCLYGQYAKGARALIDSGLKTLTEIAQAAQSLANLPAIMGLSCGPLRETECESLPEALRVAALMHSSLTAMDKLDEPTDGDVSDTCETGRRFATEVRQHVIASSPELARFFWRSAVLTDDGAPVKFGFYSPRAILHFGVLSPVRQPSSIRDARAKLWELYRARQHADLPMAGLVFGVPDENDPTLSYRQIAAMQQNLRGIEREADTYGMRFLPVHNAQEGAEKVVQYA